MVVNKRHTNKEIFQFFRYKISDMASESRARYRKTLSELDVFLSGHHSLLADYSSTMTADWAAELLCRGLAVSTVSRHLNIFSSLMKSAAGERLLPFDDSARRLSKTITDSEFVVPILMGGKVYGSCLAILRNAMKKTEGFNVYEDIFLFSLLNGALPIEDICLLKKDELANFNEVSRFIISRNISGRRGYVFDLKQSCRTPKQLSAAVTAGVQSVFQKHVSKKGFNPDDFARSVWAACAMRNGLRMSEALGYVGGEASYAVPRFCEPVQIDSDGKRVWANTVNSVLLHEMPRWYAMHMRRGVKYESLRSCILENVRPVPELFYPCETIVRQTRNRSIEVELPFVANTVFFRTSPENVLPMFNAIGERAWCYRVMGAPGSPYAVIPRKEMERFQAAIGIFTPDVEIQPLGQIAPKPGESVIIIKAGFGNRAGEVEEVINKDCETAIFRVKLTTDKGYEFRIDLDRRQIERIAN